MKRLIVTLLLAGFSINAMAQSPNDVIQQAVDEMASGLDGRKEELAANEDALYELIDNVLLPRFDRGYAAGLVLGRHKNDATEEQLSDFTDAFYGSLVRRYAEGVLKFDQDRVEILPFRGDDSKPRVQVKSIVRLDDGTKVPVTYGLIKRDSGWMMFDVTIEGISYIKNFRTEMGSEIRAKGLDAVIERLQENAQPMAAAE